jgi:HlyD family secretion protein
VTAPAPNWSAARPLVAGLLTLGFLIGGLGVWSVYTTLAGAVIAPGQIEVSQRAQVVQHLDGGLIAAILVEEGERVAAGDVLLRLDGSALRSEFAIIRTQVMELSARRARLEAQRDEAGFVSFGGELTAAAATEGEVAEMIAGQAGLFDRQARALAQATELRQARIAQIESRIQGLVVQEAALGAQKALLMDELRSLRDLLARGLVSAARVWELERELARLEGRRGEVTSAKAEAAGRIIETRIEIAALLTQSREAAEAELREVVARELELAERARALDERIARLEVRAPAAGFVLGLAVTTPQSVIGAGDTLMVIVPQDRPLLVAARVPVTHVDEVRTGQSVRLVFSTLPTHSTPEVTGKVTLVSADALTDDRTGLPFYRAEIAIDAQSLDTLAGEKMVPGMPVDAFLRTQDRTPLSYLLKPFTDYFRFAFRET